jgi:hypothetical protein
VIHGKVMIGSPAAGNLPGVALESPANQDLTGVMIGILLHGAGALARPANQDLTGVMIGILLHGAGALASLPKASLPNAPDGAKPPGDHHHLGDILLASPASQVEVGTAVLGEVGEILLENPASPGLIGAPQVGVPFKK